MSNEFDWTGIGERLAAPFPVDEVEWRPVGKPSAGARVELCAYIDARSVAARFDEVVGCGAWSFDYDVLAMKGTEIETAKGIITVHGVSKSDVGGASSWDPSKGCVSDALKRAAVLWGVGRYLYDLPKPMVTLDGYGKVPEETLAQIRRKLAARIAA
jgi:hypothetical protein